MKVCRFLKTALAGLSAMAIIPIGQVAAAADAGGYTYYPVQESTDDGKTVMPFERELSFENPLSDYAIYGNGSGKADDYAFAYSTGVYILTTNESDERQLITHVHTAQVVEVDFDSAGTLYFKDLLGASYTLTYSSAASKSAAYEGEHSFQGIGKSKLDISDEVFYTLNKEGKLTYWNNGDTSYFGDGFSMMKTYGEKVFAVKNNKPYNITDSTPDSLKDLGLVYINTDGAKNILSGDTAEKLKISATTVKIAKIKAGAYYTQIDANNIGKTFTVDERGGTQKAVGETSCLVLYTMDKSSGNASVISKDGNCYITATENLVPDEDCPYNTDGKTYYSISDVGVYSSPFISEATRIATLKSGADHPVQVLKRFNHTVFATEFCQISYEEDGKTVTGYVASGFLNVYNFAAEDKKPAEGGDAEFDYGTNVTSVVLAVTIVGLVIIAILYVSLIGVKGKGKSKKAQAKKTIAPIDELTDMEE